MLGRDKSANISIEDKLLSKFHCTFLYDIKKGWILMDGIDSKDSTNGTWLFANEDFQIFNKMIFRSNQSLFQVPC